MKILNTVLLWLLSQALVWTFYLWVLLPLFWVLIWQKQWQTAKTA